MTGEEIAWIIGGFAILFIIVILSLKFGDWIGYKCASCIFPDRSKAQKTSNSDTNGIVIISDAELSSPYTNAVLSAQLDSRQNYELPPTYNDAVDCGPTTIIYPNTIGNGLSNECQPPSYWNTT